MITLHERDSTVTWYYGNQRVLSASALLECNDLEAMDNELSPALQCRCILGNSVCTKLHVAVSNLREHFLRKTSLHLSNSN